VIVGVIAVSAVAVTMQVERAQLPTGPSGRNGADSALVATAPADIESTSERRFGDGERAPAEAVQRDGDFHYVDSRPDDTRVVSTHATDRNLMLAATDDTQSADAVEADDFAVALNSGTEDEDLSGYDHVYDQLDADVEYTLVAEAESDYLAGVEADEMLLATTRSDEEWIAAALAFGFGDTEAELMVEHAQPGSGSQSSLDYSGGTNPATSAPTDFLPQPPPLGDPTFPLSTPVSAPRTPPLTAPPSNPLLPSLPDARSEQPSPSSGELSLGPPPSQISDLGPPSNGVLGGLDSPLPPRFDETLSRLGLDEGQFAPLPSPARRPELNSLVLFLTGATGLRSGYEALGAGGVARALPRSNIRGVEGHATRREAREM